MNYTMSRTSTPEDLIMRHRDEKKELKALTNQMKNAVPKGDKKKRNDVMAEIAVMLSNLDLKHEQELKEHKAQCSSVINTSSPMACDENFSSMEVDKGSDSDEESPFPRSFRKLSKAQKRRNKRAEQEKARELAISQQELENVSGNRFVEAQEIAYKLDKKNLVLHEIPPDGSCLFKAIEHQLALHNLNGMSAAELREATANYLMSHKEEYQPFLINSQTNDIYDDGQYMEYCLKMKDPGVWGGQVEIQALAQICGRPIEIIQAYGPDIVSGERGAGDSVKLIISYHRYQFGLGAHYNSTKPKCSAEPKLPIVSKYFTQPN